MTRIQEKQAEVEARKAESAEHLYAEEDLLRKTDEILGEAVKAAAAAGPTPTPAAKDEGFFTKRVEWCWGLPRWGVGAGAVGILSAAYLAYRKFWRKGRR